jgi:hypothetical protein
MATIANRFIGKPETVFIGKKYKLIVGDSATEENLTAIVNCYTDEIVAYYPEHVSKKIIYLRVTYYEAGIAW